MVERLDGMKIIFLKFIFICVQKLFYEPDFILLFSISWSLEFMYNVLFI